MPSPGMKRRRAGPIPENVPRNSSKTAKLSTGGKPSTICPVMIAAKKRQGRPPAGLNILMMLELFLVYGLFKLCPRGKLCDLAGGYLERRAGLWIAAVTRLCLRHGERAEANQRHAIPFAECRRNAFNGGINGGRGLRLAHLACACDLVNQIGFIHSFSSQVSFMPSPDREANWLELSWET